MKGRFIAAVCLMLPGSFRILAQNATPLDPTAATNPGTLAYHLATNAVGHKTSDDKAFDSRSILSGWSYAMYTRTNLARLTNSVWSTNCWLYGVHGLSATCIGFSNSLGGQGLVTMVSPRHYLFASHMHPEGFLVAFLGTNNVIYWRKTVQRTDLTDHNIPDTSVGILNADLPPSVEFLPVVPANLSSYLPTNRADFVQGIGMNQDMRLFGQPMNLANRDVVVWNPAQSVPSGLSTNGNIAIRAGDSSNPEMLLVNHQLVLVSHNFAAVAGPNYGRQISGINQAMHYLSTNNRVGTDYQLTTFSLTNWPVIH